ncbi:hypothetical protein Tco_0231361 [Tanacetum coccineum]
MPVLHSFEESKLEYEDEDDVEIKMMGIGMDKELLEHNLYENDISLIICHNFSLTSNLPIKPKDSGNSNMKLITLSRIMEQENIQAALDQALVPTDDQVKIDSSNMRIDPTKTQKEATYQVVMNIIKLFSCYNAILIFTDVPEIYIQQFWLTITKIKKSSFYQFQFDDQKFEVDVELFQKFFCICLRVPNKEFIEPPSHDSLLTFLNQLGHKGSLDLISDIQSSVRRRENMPYPSFTKFIIYYFLSKHVFISKRQDVMVNDEIKKSVAYQTYLTLSTDTKPPKKGRGKGKGLMSKKTATPALEKKKSIPKKKGTITAEENILSDPDVAFKLGVEQALEANKEALERQKKKKMKGIASDDIPKGLSEGSSSKPEVLDKPKGKSTGSSEGVGITPEVPDEPKGKFVVHDKPDDDWEKKATESKKADEDTADEEEVHSNEEVHTKEEEQIEDEHYDEEGHEDKEMHDDDEKHNDGKAADEETADVKLTDDEKDGEEITNTAKGDEEIAGVEKVNNEQA